jgi:hypothetical protein
MCARFSYLHDAKYGLEVPAAIRSMTIAWVRTSIRSPWQNGVAERWVGSCRRDLLDHIIALNERHLRRFLADLRSLLPRGPHSPVRHILIQELEVVGKL